MNQELARYSIIETVGKLGAATPSQIARCLFETALLEPPQEPLELNDELSALVEEGFLTQSVNADGLVYKRSSASETPQDILACVTEEYKAALNRNLQELKARFEAEKDYIAQYTESSTGVVPVFLSIRNSARILLKVNLIVPDVETAKVVTGNWMKNAHKTHEAVWDCIGEGLPFPAFKPFREGQR